MAEIHDFPGQEQLPTLDDVQKVYQEVADILTRAQLPFLLLIPVGEGSQGMLSNIGPDYRQLLMLRGLLATAPSATQAYEREVPPEGKPQ
jgi:hypothetical protein